MCWQLKPIPSERGYNRGMGTQTNTPNKQSRKPRIGIYAGAFDPVHSGHIAFALQAIRTAKLDQVIFMPERRPRFKPSVEHYGHRIAMLKAAAAPHPRLAVMEVVDRHFTVRRTLPLLQGEFRNAELVFLMGSDAAITVPHWDRADRLLIAGEIVVGVRQDLDIAGIEKIVSSWKTKPKELIVFNSHAPHISSSHIRTAIRENRTADGLLKSVQRYSRDQWLYVSPATININR